MLEFPATPLTPVALEVSTFGDVLYDAPVLISDLIAAPVTVPFSATVYRLSGLYSPGPTPIDPLDPGGCCGDVAIDWTISGVSAWGIDNLVVTPVPEPSTGLLIAFGLAGLASRRR